MCGSVQAAVAILFLGGVKGDLFVGHIRAQEHAEDFGVDFARRQFHKGVRVGSRAQFSQVFDPGVEMNDMLSTRVPSMSKIKAE